MIGLLGSGKTGSYVRELSNHLEWRVLTLKIYQNTTHW